MTTTTQHTKIEIETFRADMGCLAYLVVEPETKQALVIDPRLDQVGVIVEAARRKGATIHYVLDTHTHADHLSGVAALAAQTKAKALAHPLSKQPAAELRLEHGSTLPLGGARIEVIHSPGHTPDSLALRIDDHLFTGDALFVGGAGRTDFPGGSADDLYDTFRKYEALPDVTVVHPGHDYVGQPTTTLGAEKTGNPLLAERDRAALVARLDVEGPLPAHMFEILEFNQQGPSPTHLGPFELDALRAGLTLVDVRGPSEFASSRIPGAINIPLGELSRRVGELPFGPELVVTCASGVRTRDALRILKEYGRPARSLDGGLNAWKAAGLAVEGGGRLSVERQTQLTIGVGIVLGVVLGLLVSPWFLAIPAAMGAGLMLAGITGSCPLAIFLGKLPWNRLDGDGETGTSACAVGGGGSACAVGGGGSACAVGGGRAAA